jgi:uncharacterized protein (DUF1015 family)
VATPLLLLPFRALMMTGARVGDPASGRALARPHREVARRLARWERTGRLDREASPALYLHEYTVNGITVRGLVGALDLSRRVRGQELPAVLPHEAVHPRQSADLAARMHEMGMNPAPILLVHRGPAAVRALLRTVAGSPPMHEYHDRVGQIQRLWAIRDPDQLRTIEDELAGTHALLADGHHRYAAYLALQAAEPGTAWDRGLAMLVDQDDTALFLGAIHRLLEGTSLAAVADAVTRVPGLRCERAAETTAIAALAADTIVVTDGTEWAVVRLDRIARPAVEVLHRDVVPMMAPPPDGISHHHTVHDLLTRMEPHRDVAVLMPAPDFDLVHATVAAGRLLPEKATSFQPKPTLGVLMRSVDDG